MVLNEGGELTTRPEMKTEVSPSTHHFAKLRKKRSRGIEDKNMLQGPREERFNIWKGKVPEVSRIDDNHHDGGTLGTIMTRRGVKVTVLTSEVFRVKVQQGEKGSYTKRFIASKPGFGCYLSIAMSEPDSRW